MDHTNEIFLGYGINSWGTFVLTKQTYSTLALSTVNYKLTAALKRDIIRMATNYE